jgi:hypothetical protein
LGEYSSINTCGGSFVAVRYEKQKLINKGRRRDFFVRVEENQGRYLDVTELPRQQSTSKLANSLISIFLMS